MRSRHAAMLTTATLLGTAGGGHGAPAGAMPAADGWAFQPWSVLCEATRKKDVLGARQTLAADTLQLIADKAGVSLDDPGACDGLGQRFAGRRLDLSRAGKALDLGMIVKLTGIRSLDLSHDGIADAQGLRLTYPNGAVLAGGLEHSLVEIDLSHNALTSVQPLADYAALERIDLSDNDLPDLADLTFDARWFPGRHDAAGGVLDVSRNPRFAYDAGCVTAELLGKEWTELRLSGTRIDDLTFLEKGARQSLAVLVLDDLALAPTRLRLHPRMPELLYLSARGTTGFPWAFLGADPACGGSCLPELRVVDATQEGLDAAAVDAIAALPRLTLLSLAGGTAPGVSVLTKSSTLDALSLYGLSVTDAGLVVSRANLGVLDLQGMTAPPPVPPGKRVLADACPAGDAGCRRADGGAEARTAVLLDEETCAARDAGGACTQRYGACPKPLRPTYDQVTQRLTQICCDGVIQMPFGAVSDACADIPDAAAIF